MKIRYLNAVVCFLSCVLWVSDSLAFSGEERPLSGGYVLWFFVGINMGLLGLAFAVRKYSTRGKPVSEMFVTSSSYKVGDNPSVLHDVLGWLVDQADRGGFSSASVIKLYNAIEEVVIYVLQKATAAGIKESITINTVIRKGVGNVTITHTGPALEIHKFKPLDLMTTDPSDVEGLELHLAFSQVDALEYFALISHGTSSFRLRRALK